MGVVWMRYIAWGEAERVALIRLELERSEFRWVGEATLGSVESGSCSGRTISYSQADHTIIYELDLVHIE